MRDKNIKTWLFVFVATLVVTSGGASFYAQKQTFYKGLEPLQWNFAKASSLTVEENTLEFLPAVEPKPVEQPQPVSPTPTNEPKIVAEVEPVSSPCRGAGVPIIKNGQIRGCTGAKTTAEVFQDQSTSVVSFAPKIKIIELQAPLSCESQGRFTYTGEDQPGLLYGMCIDCLTTEFAANGGKCKK